VINVRVMLHAEKHRNTCEILIVAKDHDAKAVQESEISMADAINAAVDHIKRQAQKNREKIRDHHRGESETVVEATEHVS
jgi:ribosome-associated translation inhibitor RaiA